MNRRGDEYDMLELVKLVPPCEHVLRQLKGARPTRRLIPLALLHAPPGVCVWCGTKLTGRQRRWCSPECTSSALFWCQPQTPQSKMTRLIYMQNSACAGCGQCFEEDIRKRIVKWYLHVNSPRRYEKDQKISFVSLHLLGYATGNIWQVDHIQPIWDGGHGTDPDNLQVLCIHCHQSKTSAEAGRRSKA